MAPQVEMASRAGRQAKLTVKSSLRQAHAHITHTNTLLSHTARCWIILRTSTVVYTLKTKSTRGTNRTLRLARWEGDTRCGGRKESNSLATLSDEQVWIWCSAILDYQTISPRLGMVFSFHIQSLVFDVQMRWLCSCAVEHVVCCAHRFP